MFQKLLPLLKRRKKIVDESINQADKPLTIF